MYIWILLATIMATLCFYNISPRIDKDNSIAETKASTLVMRLKIENHAVAETLKCDLMYNMFADYGQLPKNLNIDTGIENLTPELGVSVEENLPLGYKVYKSSEDKDVITHQVICLDKNVQYPDARLTGCQGLSVDHPEYIFSFMPIPDRWLSKDGSKPLPALLNHLASRDSKTHIGWVEHVDNSYIFYGANASGGKIEYDKTFSKESEIDLPVKDGITLKPRDIDIPIVGEISGGGIGGYLDRDDNGSTKDSYSVTSYSFIPKDSVFWSETFNSVCESTPCLAAVTRIPTYDDGSYCKQQKEEYEANSDKANKGDDDFKTSSEITLP